MKTLSPLQIRQRIANLGYAKLGRKNTELEMKRIFWMEQVLISEEIKYHQQLKKQGAKLLIGDRLC